MKRNNRILLIVLILLIAAFALTRVFRAPARESNLDKDVFKIDTAEIASVTFQPMEKGAEINLIRSDSGWQVREGSESAAAGSYQVSSFLQALASLEPERVVSRRKAKWNQYQVGDSASIEITTYSKGGTKIGAWYLGKERGGSTFLRPANETEVYAVEGSLRARFNKTFDEWRDKTFLRIKRNTIDKVTFDYPADSGFVLTRNAGAWTVGEHKADSLKVANYLGKLRSKELPHFADTPPSGPPDVELVIQGAGRTKVTGWKNGDHKWILSSSLQEGVYFSDSTFADDLFIGKKALVESN